jgi:hypothetical protein
MSRVVLFQKDGSVLLLKDPRFDSDGRVVRGWVVNGAWAYEVEGNLCLARTDFGRKVMNSWVRPPAEEEQVVTIPTEIPGGYEKAIRWAEAQRGR